MIFTKALQKMLKQHVDTSSFKLNRTLPREKKQKSYRTNERWIRWKNHERIC